MSPCPTPASAASRTSPRYVASSRFTIAELAACHANDEQRNRIKRIARSLEATIPLSEFRVADHRFHAAIATPCGSPSLAEFYDKVLETLFTRRTSFTRQTFDSLLSASDNESVARLVIRDHQGPSRHRRERQRRRFGRRHRAAEMPPNQVEALLVAQMT